MAGARGKEGTGKKRRRERIDGRDGKRKRTHELIEHCVDRQTYSVHLRLTPGLSFLRILPSSSVHGREERLRSAVDRLLDFIRAEQINEAVKAGRHRP